MWRFIKGVKRPEEGSELTEEEVVRNEVVRLRKREKSNAKYDAETRAKVAKYAIMNGNAKAVKKFNVPESTVRNFKKKYNELTNASEGYQPPTEIANKYKGRPLKLGTLDSIVQR